jgi:hypothetical protein
VSSLIRQEALLRFRDKAYDFQSLFDGIEKQPESWESVLQAGVIWCDREQLVRLGESYKAAKNDHANVSLADLNGSCPAGHDPTMGSKRRL